MSMEEIPELEQKEADETDEQEDLVEEDEA
jgi:hypothetical protein